MGVIFLSFFNVRRQILSSNVFSSRKSVRALQQQSVQDLQLSTAIDFFSFEKIQNTER